MNIEKRLNELDLKIPEIEDRDLPFVSGVIVDNLVYLSGQTSKDGDSIKHCGVVGSSITIEQAQEAAEVCILNLIGALKKLIGNLDNVKRIVKLNGYVVSERNFFEQPKVINAASILLNKIFGNENQHARAAIGVAALPGGTPVEIELIVELHS
ncbi:RidA family protein [Niallia sp. Sow4_A1]|uniref:RidA family protein n=1 Tax=Niallia sp. Sow4_A1 TaxID=3438793 RepID=UPI003F95B3FE